MKTNRFMPLVLFFGATLLLISQSALAGPPEKPGNPGVPGLLAEISYLQSVISDQQDIIDELEELLDQLQSSAPVQRTGATQSYSPGDDGDINAGVQWPVPRFTDKGDGTVTDNLTGLIWLKNSRKSERKRRMGGSCCEVVLACMGFSLNHCSIVSGL